MARELNEAGYERTFQQCHDKIKKLRGDKHGKAGEDRSNWDYFDAMDAVLGNRPATKPPVVIDTSSAPVADNPEEQQEEDEPEQDKDIETLSRSSSTA